MHASRFSKRCSGPSPRIKQSMDIVGYDFQFPLFMGCHDHSPTTAQLQFCNSPTARFAASTMTIRRRDCSAPTGSIQQSPHKSHGQKNSAPAARSSTDTDFSGPAKPPAKLANRLPKNTTTAGTAINACNRQTADSERSTGVFTRTPYLSPAIPNWPRFETTERWQTRHSNSPTTKSRHAAVCHASWSEWATP